jgi:hypothetical protein
MKMRARRRRMAQRFIVRWNLGEAMKVTSIYKYRGVYRVYIKNNLSEGQWPKSECGLLRRVA